MVRVFVMFLRTYFAVDPSDIRVTCSLFADHVARQREIEDFWLDRGWSQWLSMSLFVAAGITDYFDGYFARRYHQISRLGSKL